MLLMLLRECESIEGAGVALCHWAAAMVVAERWGGVCKHGGDGGEAVGEGGNASASESESVGADGTGRWTCE